MHQTAGTINAHIRHGDKWIEMPLVPTPTYVDTFLDIVGYMPMSNPSPTLLVTADSEDSVQVRTK